MTKRLRLGAMLIMLATPVAAQQGRVAFGSLEQDTGQPVEVSADQLTVNNADGTAVFSGNVVVTQGEMQLSAAEVRVRYGADQTAIEQLVATGGVKVTNLADTAQGDEAVYTIASGQIVLTGNVLLAQGRSPRRRRRFR